MNILQHKSWHVYSRDNIERVRKDEEKHRLAEEEKATRAAIAEAEARMSQLRSQARQRYGSEIKEEGAEMGEAPRGPDGHVNFFYDVEKAREAQSLAEREKEKKQEQLEWEKRVGVLTYLGQSASETTGKKQFYETMPATTVPPEEVEDPKERKRKERHDPLAVMDKYLAIKAAKPPSPKSKSKHDDHESKKEKKKKKDKSKNKEKDSKAERLAKLREERLARERQEQLRARQMKTETRMQPEPEQMDQGYSSQFNPQLARQNRSRDQRHRPY
eukprot:comp13259_c0_seq1/m.8648 comp13259_c0_seq1/g.8648  ORF comp13259_c0_seq1/g.8648 comp13259_c0_seq1/m.8648 type:complete len:273 (-) comp13259_c0_seq1:73-891(-)